MVKMLLSLLITMKRIVFGKIILCIVTVVQSVQQ